MRGLLLFLLLTMLAHAQTLEDVVNQAIADKKCPGAVVLVGHNGEVIYRKAFGNRAVEPTVEPMTVDTVFDLASLTKVVCTAPCVMKLVEGGQLRLSDPLSKFFPMQDEKAGAVTIEQLLTHLSGFRAGLDRTRPWQGLAGAQAELEREVTHYPPGTHFEYSDINYIALGLIVQKVSGMPLDQFARQTVYAPLKMTHTSFGPRPEAAPTERRGGEMIQGTVHDHVSGRMGGVSGHAGLFSTVDDLAIFCQSVLDGGAGVLSPATVARMQRPVVVSGVGHTRGLGWDIDTLFSSNRGELFPKGSVGHTGWTGTSLWIDPGSRSYVIFLSNRVHPDGTGDVTPTRARVGTLAAAMLKDFQPRESDYAAEVTAGLPAFLARRQTTPIVDAVPSSRTLTGIDVLVEDGFRPLKGKRLGLVTNHTGRDRQGHSTISLLQPVRLFSPEHGLEGKLDEPIPSTSRVISLYGETRRPRQEDLQGLDAVVFDIQDAGTRFYTYSATLLYLLEECSRGKIPVVVLDRPNPLNGMDVEGPVADADRESFTCPHTLPVRHGMTMGELAQMYNGERKIGADLRVIRMDPWSRGLWFDQTQQTWISPSPNLRSLNAALLYPGVGLLEFTNVSVGRGTDRPFEQFGAPWLDHVRLATLVNVPGVRLVPVFFTPTSSHYAGQECRGVQFLITDRAVFRPVRLGMELASALLRLHPREFQREGLGKLIANADTLQRLLAGETPAQIERSWQPALDEFRKRRAPWLIYK